MCEHCERAERMLKCFPEETAVGDFLKTLATMIHAVIPPGEELLVLANLADMVFSMSEKGQRASLH